MDNTTIEKVRSIVESGIVKENEPMSKHTTFKIGGNAKIYTIPANTSELSNLVKYCTNNNIDFYILGNGSNILVSDNGYEGIIIQTQLALNNISVGNQNIYAKAGVLLSKISQRAMEHELTGLEFAGGIPGSLGGAVIMNAGAYENEIFDYIDMVDVMSFDGEIKTLKKEDIKYGYRYTDIKYNNYIVIGAKLKLKTGIREDIESLMKEYNNRRKDTQPLEYPSAGSIFKRPIGDYAGRLIEEAGLKGRSLGGARVSYKHAGFIVNENHATASDVKMLIDTVISEVKNKSGITLETEIDFVGNF